MGFFVVFFVLYLAPTIIALCRGHASKWAILAVNLLLGWSIIGWLWAFIWSLANKGAVQNVTVINKNNQSN